MSVNVQVRTGQSAVERLRQLDLTVDAIERTVRRADAEARLCTPMDPPMLEGLIRWGRTVRYLREELVPVGWGSDDPRNFSRTIHPSGSFALVISSGDQNVGDEDHNPKNRNPKGVSSEDAVRDNGQFAFELPEIEELLPTEMPKIDEGAPTWYLLFFVADDRIQVELSLPDEITNGQFTGWIERIILPSFPLEDDGWPIQGRVPDDPDDVEVRVNRR